MVRKSEVGTVQVITLRPGQVFRFAPQLAPGEAITSATVTGRIGVFEILEVTATSVLLRGIMRGSSAMRVRTNQRTIDLAVIVRERRRRPRRPGRRRPCRRRPGRGRSVQEVENKNSVAH